MRKVYRCSQCGGEAIADHPSRPTALCCLDPSCRARRQVTFCVVCRDALATGRLRDMRPVCAGCMVTVRNRQMPPTPMEVAQVREGLLSLMRRIGGQIR